MKKRLKKKVLKQMAVKVERAKGDKVLIKPSEIEGRVIESIFARELGLFRMKEFEAGTLYEGNFIERFTAKIKEIHQMLTPEGLREQAKRL